MTAESDKSGFDPEKWRQRTLSSNNLMRPDNVQLVQGCALLGSACKGMSPLPTGIMSAQDSLHLSVKLSSYVLSHLVARGDTYHQTEWVLYEAHFQLLQMMLDAAKNKETGKSDVVSRFCENLSGLLNCSNIPPGKQILELQEKVSIPPRERGRWDRVSAVNNSSVHLYW